MSREGDIVLIHYQGNPSIYARIEAIEPDVKKAWYQVTLLLLNIPPQQVQWILREEYINGDDFTMGGKPIRLEEVKRSLTRVKIEDDSQKVRKKNDKTVKVIPFKNKTD